MFLTIKYQLSNTLSPFVLKKCREAENSHTLGKPSYLMKSIIPIEVGKENIDKQATKFSPGNFSLNLSVTTGVIRLLILGDTT